MGRTRHQAKHVSILTVHKRSKPKSTALERGGKMLRGIKSEETIETDLKEYIKKEGITGFISRCFVGDIDAGHALYSRREIVSLIDRSKGFRGFVSRKWRDEDEHHHEWIPCTYISVILSRALQSQNFRFMWLANNMRSPTENILFRPNTDNTFTVRGIVYKVLQAHQGGLNFRRPAGDPLGPMPAGVGPADRAMLPDGAFIFHNDIIKALNGKAPDGVTAAALAAPANDPAVVLVRQLQATFQAHCWTGLAGAIPFPIEEIWPYYYQHGAVVAPFPHAAAIAAVVAAGAAVAAPVAPAAALAYAQNAFNAVNGQFNQWAQQVTTIPQAPANPANYL